MAKKSTPKLVSLGQAAEITNYSRQGIHHMIKTGKLPAVMVGNQFVIRTKELLDAIPKTCPRCGQHRHMELA